MTDRDEAGQFAEPAFGREGLEREQGFVPYVDENKVPDPEPEIFENAREAANSVSNTAESDVRTFSSLDNLPDNVVLTLDQAADRIGDARAADEAHAELEHDEQLKKEVDDLRGTDAKEPAAELTPERIAEHPAFKESVEKLTSETEEIKQTYVKGVDLANQFARAAFMGDFPEIAAMPLEQWEGALVTMAQQQPERFGKAMSQLNRVAELERAQQFQQQQKTLAERQEFNTFAKTQDDTIDKLMKGESAQSQRAIMDEIMAGAKEAGVDQNEFLKMFGHERVMRHSAFQKMMVDAAKYRLMMKTKTAVASKPVPQVQRPGTSNVVRQDSQSSKIQALQRSLDGATGHRAARIAAEILSERRR